ncbi:6772_t:CDS:2 [Funneliformis geosporum]|uniref:15053_t:CDS:1 n=1 Tax=Funneliformis geosporum TaxID=1117311 RepID=A0A9W4SI48_9GLOM|nr:15053_t:CDS:2 [Funneliformis geosporum]CAI2179846.1 6772_t:CDS:2 [Funneliformis geosporum]
MDGSTLFSRRLFKRKFKVYPQQKCAENRENPDMNKSISNSRSGFVSQKSLLTETSAPGEEIVIPSNKSSKTQNCDNMQENTKDGLSRDDAIVLRSEDIIQQQKVVLESNGSCANIANALQQDTAEATILNAVHKSSTGNYIEWLGEIKNMYFNLLGKINLFKKSDDVIVKDHWKKDHTAKCCSFCHKKFTMFFRRHHCRICGFIFCSTCSSGKTLLDPNLAMPVQFVAATASNRNINYNHQTYGQFEHDHENEQEFDENNTDDYFSDDSINTDYSYSSSDSSSFFDFNNTTCDLIYSDDSSMVMNNDDECDKNDKIISFESEPVRERICINCHAFFELDEKDWFCD